MFKFNSLIIALFICSSIISFEIQAQNPLESALDYTIFTLNDATLDNNECEGAVAIGGNLILDGAYTLGNNSAGSFYDDTDAFASSLVVGGRIIYNGGNGVNVTNGYVKICDTTDSYIYSDGIQPTRITPNLFDSTPRITISQSQTEESIISCPIDFQTAFDNLQAQTLSLAACESNIELQPIDPNNPNNETNKKRIILPNETNILNLTWAELNSISELGFTNQPSASATLIINIDASAENGDLTWNLPNFPGVSDSHGAYIIWNFYNTTSLIMVNTGTIYGTILAPFADVVDSNNGNINGQVAALSFVHNGGEMHHHPFEGNAIGCNTVSEPTSCPTYCISISITKNL